MAQNAACFFLIVFIHTSFHNSKINTKFKIIRNVYAYGSHFDIISLLTMTMIGVNVRVTVCMANGNLQTS